MHLVDVARRPLDVLSEDTVSLSGQLVDAAIVSSVVYRDRAGGVATPSVSSGSAGSPIVCNHFDVFLGPGSKVSNVVSNGLGRVSVTSSRDTGVPRVDIGVVLWGNVKGPAINDEVSQCLGEVVTQSEVVICLIIVGDENQVEQCGRK